MKDIRARSRLATAVVTLAAAVAAAGAAVDSPASAGTPPSASASTPTTYNCAFTISVLGVPVSATLPVPVTVDLPEVPMRDGVTVPAGSVPVSMALDLGALTDIEGLGVANAIVQLIGLDGVLGGRVGLDATHALSVGSVPVTAAVTAAPVVLGDLLTSGVLTGSGSLDSFAPRGAGREDVSLPAAFDLVPSGMSGPSVGSLLPVTFAPVTCASATGAPAVVGRVDVVAAGTRWAPVSSRLRVVGPKHARSGRPVAFRATLPGGAGRIFARVGQRMVGQAVLVDGQARVRVRGLVRGTNRITFTAGTARAVATVRVR